MNLFNRGSPREIDEVPSEAYFTGVAPEYFNGAALFTQFTQLNLFCTYLTGVKPVLAFI